MTEGPRITRLRAMLKDIRARYMATKDPIQERRLLSQYGSLYFPNEKYLDKVLIRKRLKKFQSRAGGKPKQ